MNRLDAFMFLRRFLRDRQAVRFALATEALMERLADHFGADPNLWGLTGLLAWVDQDLTRQNPKSRGRTAAEMLSAERLPGPLTQAVGDRLTPGPHDDLLTRALAAAEAAAPIVLEGVADRAALDRLDEAALERLCDDPSNAPRASRTRILALAGDGLDLGGLLRLSREALLSQADDLGL